MLLSPPHPPTPLTPPPRAAQGHVFSLGSTLSAALSFVTEPELGVELGEELQKLLEQMQEEKPEDRPLLQVAEQPLLLALFFFFFFTCTLTTAEKKNLKSASGLKRYKAAAEK